MTAHSPRYAARPAEPVRVQRSHVATSGRSHRGRANAGPVTAKLCVLAMGLFSAAEMLDLQLPPEPCEV